MRKFLFEITEHHVAPAERAYQGESLRLHSAIGRVLSRDVGKRVYDVDGVIQVENDEQRDRRQAADAADESADYLMRRRWEA